MCWQPRTEATPRLDESRVWLPMVCAWVLMPTTARWFVWTMQTRHTATRSARCTPSWTVIWLTTTIPSPRADPSRTLPIGRDSAMPSGWSWSRTKPQTESRGAIPCFFFCKLQVQGKLQGQVQKQIASPKANKSKLQMQARCNPMQVQTECKCKASASQMQMQAECKCKRTRDREGDGGAPVRSACPGPAPGGGLALFTPWGWDWYALPRKKFFSKPLDRFWAIC